MNARPFSSTADAGEDAGAFSEINMVPLVDVMLVLLILFMLVVPVAGRQLSLSLPAATGDAAAPSVPAVLALTADGGLFWNGESIAAADWPARWRGLATSGRAATHPSPPLIIQADGRVPYERLAKVLDSARAAGVVDVRLQVQPSEDRSR